MGSKIIGLIKKTNGDALGVLLFAMLIIHFLMFDTRTLFENALLVSCVIAFFVDLVIVLQNM